MSDKKKALQAHKEKLLAEIRYYDKRIEEFRTKGNSSFANYECSSDSEDDYQINMDLGPSISELKLEQTQLRTRLQATQELTSLQILQSEVKVLVADPEITSGRSVMEEGVWREVTAECRVDMVPFTIIFYVQKPYRKFGAYTYRELRVSVVKSAHERELASSVLESVKQPSDAVEVIRSYSAAHRSRRTTLARLAEKYAGSLFMEPMVDGGYTLKCADLLEVSWVLQNKTRVGPFQHRMRFDLEYMDESYIKAISQVHRQLSDPTISTDERTLLLAKIINIVLEAKGPTQELYESMESSDPETASRLRTRRTTLDQPEPVSQYPVLREKKDNEVMAPPKSLPKKVKKNKHNAKDLGKDGADDNKSVTTDEEDRTVTERVMKSVNKHVAENSVKDTENKLKESANVVKKSKTVNTIDNGKANTGKVTGKNEVTKSKGKENAVNAKTLKKAGNTKGKGDGNIENELIAESNNKQVQNKHDANAVESGNKPDKIKEKGHNVNEEVISKSKNNRVENKKDGSEGTKKNVNKANVGENEVSTKTKTSNVQNKKEGKSVKTVKQNDKADTNRDGNTNKNIDNIENKKDAIAGKKTKNPENHRDKDKINSNADTENNAKKEVNKPLKRLNSDNQVQNAKKIKTGHLPENAKNRNNKAEKKESDRVTSNTKTVTKSTENKKKVPEKLNDNKNSNSADNIQPKNLENKNKISVASSKNETTIQKVVEKSKLAKSNTVVVNQKFKNKNYQNVINNKKTNVLTKIGNENNKNIKNGIEKVKGSVSALTKIGNGVKKVDSKIPQKANLMMQGFSKKSHLRISPRKTPSKFKMTSIQKLSKMPVQKSISSIPRLLKKMD